MCVCVCVCDCDPYPAQTLNSWCVPLLKSCEDYLSRMVSQQRDSSPQDGEQVGSIWSDQSEKEAIRYLFTLGEVVHVSAYNITVQAWTTEADPGVCCGLDTCVEHHLTLCFACSLSTYALELYISIL